MAGSLAGRLVDWDMFPFEGPWFLHPSDLVTFLKDRWKGICREAVLSRRLEELHATRDDLLAVFKHLITLQKTHLRLLDLREQLMGRNGHPRWPREELERAVEELTRLKDDIFSNWHTADDLAEILVENFTLTSEQLRAYADRNPPPQSWYDETDDPFAPQE